MKYMKHNYSGGCHCGNVKFTIRGKPVWKVNCYCNWCQTTSGGPFRSFVLFDDENIEFIGPYDKLSIMNVNGRNESAEIMPIFSECKPRSSFKGTMFPINEYISRKDAPLTLEGNFIEYEDLLKTSTEPLSTLADVKGQYSQLWELLAELGLRLDLDFQSDYQYRKIIIFYS